MLFFLWPQILTKFTTQESHTFDSHDMIYSSKLYMRAFQKHLLLFQNEIRLYCLKKLSKLYSLEYAMLFIGILYNRIV